MVPAIGRGLGIEEILGPFRSKIEKICESYAARDVRVFGSVAKRTATAESDVDFLVDFDRTRRVRSTLRAIDLALGLEAILHRPVVVATETGLHWFVQPQIIAEAVPL